MNEVVGTFDRKRRLARQIAIERGWDPVTVSAWLIVVDSRTNRRRVGAHETMLRGALPDDGRTMARWLRDPSRAVAGLSFWAGGAASQVEVTADPTSPGDEGGGGPWPIS